MSSLKFTYSIVRGELETAFKDFVKPIAAAATAAVREAGEQAKVQGRADIASAGFSIKWQQALRVENYPRGNVVSIDAAALIHHKIPYAEVFEDGATIRGKPILWLPLSSTPKRIGNQRLTPKIYEQRFGPLRFIKRTGKPPLLAGEVSGRRVRRKGAKISIGSLHRAAIGRSAGAGGGIQTVPLFVGIDVVSIRKRFSIRAIIARAADRLGELYFKHLKAD